VLRVCRLFLTSYYHDPAYMETMLLP